jgi:hypothetical protein
MLDRVRLTTADNPYNPFTDWDEWYFFDISKGYCTCERINRIAKTSYQLSDELNNDEVENAIDQLVETGAISKDGAFVKYVKVYAKEAKGAENTVETPKKG